MKDDKPRLTFYCVGCGDRGKKIRVGEQVEIECSKCESSYKTLSLKLEEGFLTIELTRYKGKIDYHPQIEYHPTPFCPLCGRPKSLELIKPEHHTFKCSRCERNYLFLYNEEAFE